MSALAKSMASLPWASSVLGMQQTTNQLFHPRDSKAAADLYRVTDVIQQQFASNPFAYAANEIGNFVQSKSLDFFADLSRLQAFNPEWVKDVAGAFLKQVMATTRALAPGPRRDGSWAALQNTLAVVNLVNQAAAMLQLSADEIELESSIERAYSFGAYSSLWLVEGLGREYADRNWLKGAPPIGLLTTNQGYEIPDSSLLMLHAGMGISFARRFVGLLTPFSSRLEVTEALDHFAGLIKSNSRVGYEGAAFESLGLVTRTWYPEMVPLVEQTLWTSNRELVEYFWHGLGRAAYFSPFYMVPGNTPFDGIAKEAPHRLGLANATAGAAWAFTLVNIRQPEIIVNLLQEYAGPSLGAEFFSNGMTSALMMATETIPGDPYAQTLCQYVPKTADTDLLAQWDQTVRGPCREARELYLPLLKLHDRLGEMFRYHDLNEFVRCLEEAI
jgi:hypothetical protein